MFRACLCKHKKIWMPNGPPFCFSLPPPIWVSHPLCQGRILGFTSPAYRSWPTFSGSDALPSNWPLPRQPLCSSQERALSVCMLGGGGGGIFSTPASPDHLFPHSSAAVNFEIRFITQKLISAEGSTLSAGFRRFRDTKWPEPSEERGFLLLCG